jgi:FkbM family methyltransferase
MKTKLKQVLHSLGWEITRYYPKPDPWLWLKQYDIQTVIDVGANVGQFAKEIRVPLPEAQIYSFEPIKECYEELTRAFQNDTAFKAFNVGLGEKEETLQITVSPYSPSSSLLKMAALHEDVFPRTKGGFKERVSMERLDTVGANLDLIPNILIKLDVQGFEDRVIRGGQQVIAKARVLIVETSFDTIYEGGPLFDSIYDQLRSLGFRYAGTLGGKSNPFTGSALFEDSIFVRK